MLSARQMRCRHSKKSARERQFAPSRAFARICAFRVRFRPRQNARAPETAARRASPRTRGREASGSRSDGRRAGRRRPAPQPAQTGEAPAHRPGRRRPPSRFSRRASGASRLPRRALCGSGRWRAHGRAFSTNSWPFSANSKLYPANSRPFSTNSRPLRGAAHKRNQSIYNRLRKSAATAGGDFGRIGSAFGGGAAHPAAGRLRRAFARARSRGVWVFGP